MNHLRVYALIVLIGGVLATGLAFAQDQGAGAGRRGRDQARAAAGGRGGAGLALRGVNLTDAQQQQIRVLTEQHREQNRASTERLRAA
ncbi:MAG TPA: hypothetical protein VM819_07600, partial [Vicinamibacterales bacterium]|nr:hypothetical protein [Vicinamibacterales bacterium]